MRISVNNTMTILILFLLISLISATSLTRGSIRAQTLLPGDAPVVSPILDEARAVRQLVSTEGGEIIATAADGTKFTLTIPKGALRSEEEITLTPLSSVENLPFSGGVAGAVQIEPDGLALLFSPATLTIEPAASVSVNDECPFAWSSSGEDFHLYSLTLDVTKLEMTLPHFGGYGIARGTAAERAAQHQRHPADSWAQLEQTLQNFSDESRRRLSQPGLSEEAREEQVKLFSEAVADELLKVFNAIDQNAGDDALQPGVVRASSEESMRCDLAEFMRWIDTFTYFDDGELSSLPPLVPKKLQKKLGKSLKQARERMFRYLDQLARLSSQRWCRDRNLEDFALLQDYHWTASAIAGKFGDPKFDGLATKIHSMLRDCSRFKVVFDSTLRFQVDKDDVVVAATVQVRLEADIELDDSTSSPGKGAYPSGLGTLRHIQNEWTSSPCSITTKDKHDADKVLVFAAIHHGQYLDYCKKDRTVVIRLNLNLQDVPTESVRVTCPDDEGYSWDKAGLWFLLFSCVHGFDEDSLVITIRLDRVAGGGSIVARKQFGRPNQDCEGWRVSEDTKIELHTAN